AGLVLAAVDAVQLHTGAPEQVLRQPAHAAVVVLPEILEDVDHLQTLPEGNAERAHSPAVGRDRGRVVAEQFGERFADHAGHVVAVLIQRALIAQPGGAGRALIAGHAFAHDPHAA